VITLPRKPHGVKAVGHWMYWVLDVKKVSHKRLIARGTDYDLRQGISGDKLGPLKLLYP
jgi:hypothetical protein